MLKYIDYDLDMKVFPDQSYTLLDEDEYEQHKKEMNYPQEIDIILKRTIQTLKQWIQQKKGPFAPDFIDAWTARYQLHKDIQKTE